MTEDGIIVREGCRMHESYVGDTCVGFAITVPWNDGYFICKLQVKPLFRNQGIGGALMRSIVDRAGVPLYLRPEPFNDKPVPADRLADWYQTRFGFQDIGEIDGSQLMRLEPRGASCGTGSTAG